MKNWAPGINHLDYWVSNLDETLDFFEPVFQITGWKRSNKNSFSTDNLEIYFKEEKSVKQHISVGPRHICLQAISKNVVDQIAELAINRGFTIDDGPRIMDYSEGYYAIYLLDPDGYKIEIAYTPNMKL